MVERIKAISEVFVEHIQNHLDKNQKVVCKICNKTIDEIYDEATKKENHLWIQPGIYNEDVIYVDNNGTPFKVKRFVKK